jgi:orotidine-5'-phosphate decarboxylase
MKRDGFKKLLKKKWKQKKFVCIGLDSQYDKIPEIIRKNISVRKAIERFNQEIIDATHDLVCAYKPNIAFYEAQGTEGLEALIKTTSYIHKKYPDIPVILDAKRADIGTTNEGYVKAIFGIIGVDAVTVQPYLGKEAMEPFLEQKDKGIIIICRASNPGAREYQDLIVNHSMLGEVPLYQVVAYQVVNEWNTNRNCCLAAGATYPEELTIIRRIAPDLPFLIPGIGKQGGDVEKAVVASKDKRNEGIIINSSREIIFASQDKDFAQAARKEVEKLDKKIKKSL